MGNIYLSKKLQYFFANLWAVLLRIRTKTIANKSQIYIHLQKKNNNETNKKIQQYTCCTYVEIKYYSLTRS